MATVRFLERTGKDLFEFMRRAEINSNVAMQWALETFVTIDGKRLDVTDIAKLSNRSYIQITSKIFSFDDPEIIANNEGIKYKNHLIRSKEVSRNFITELQTSSANSKNDGVVMMKKCITSMYDVTIEEIEKMPYQLVAFLVQKITFYLTSLTTASDQFEIDDFGDLPPASVADGELGSLL